MLTCVLRRYVDSTVLGLKRIANSTEVYALQREINRGDFCKQMRGDKKYTLVA